MTNLIQEKVATGSGISSLTVTFDRNTSPGNTLILVCNIVGDTQRITNVSSPGASWLLAKRSIVSGTFATGIETWYASNVPATRSVDLTFNTALAIGVNIHERTGLQKYGPVHTTVENINLPGSTTISCGSYDPEDSFLMVANESGPFEMAPPIDHDPAGWTLFQFFDGTRIGNGSWKDVTVADGALDPQTTWTNSASNLGQMTVFRLSGAISPGRAPIHRGGRGSAW